MTPEERIINQLNFKDMQHIQVPFTTYDTKNTANVLLPRVEIIVKNISHNYNTDDVFIK